MLDSAGRDARPVVSVIFPCLDEADSIARCVCEARIALERLGYSGEVVVCDNGSCDGTADAAQRAGARVVRQPIRGYGAACLRGLEAARGDYLVLVDGDGTYDLGSLHRFVEPMRAGYDLVLGTRRNGVIGRGAMPSQHLHLLEPIQTQLSRRFLSYHVSDVRCGMRGLSRAGLETMRLSATGMEFAGEMLVEAARAQLATVEVPVTFVPRPEGRSRRKVGDGWRMVRFLLLLSPVRLFLVPGLALLALGLATLLALLPGPIRVGQTHVDYHFMFVGGTVALLGLQTVLLGLYAKTYSLIHNRSQPDPWLVAFHRWYRLERGVALGASLFGSGLSINLWILTRWLSAGAGILFAVRPAILALTLMVIGAEIVFASLFISVLRGSEWSRV